MFLNIHILGKWNKCEIQNLLCDYDYLILPSKEEPFGIVLLEALASGIPCIVSNALGPNEIIKNKYNGLVFDKLSFDNFIEVMNISKSMDDSQYYDMCENSEKDALKYSTENIVKKWIELIESK